MAGIFNLKQSYAWLLTALREPDLATQHLLPTLTSYDIDSFDTKARRNKMAGPAPSMLSSISGIEIKAFSSSDHVCISPRFSLSQFVIIDQVCMTFPLSSEVVKVGCDFMRSSPELGKSQPTLRKRDCFWMPDLSAHEGAVWITILF